MATAQSDCEIESRGVTSSQAATCLPFVSAAELSRRALPKTKAESLPTARGRQLHRLKHHIFLLAAGVGGNQRPHFSDFLSFLVEKNSVSRHEKFSAVQWCSKIKLVGKSRVAFARNAYCLRKMLKKWADEIALTLRLQTSSDSVQLFEDRDDPTSNVFIEVFEDFIDASFTKAP